MCKLITGESLSLGQALNKIENKNMIQLHPALKQVFRAYMDILRDSDGIRHGLSEECRLRLRRCKIHVSRLFGICKLSSNVKWNK